MGDYFGERDYCPLCDGDGDDLAREALAYLATVEAMRAAGYDPHEEARKVKPPPLDVETIYSEAAWAQLDRRGVRPPSGVPCCENCGTVTAWPVTRCVMCVGR